MISLGRQTGTKAAFTHRYSIIRVYITLENKMYKVILVRYSQKRRLKLRELRLKQDKSNTVCVYVSGCECVSKCQDQRALWLTFT